MQRRRPARSAARSTAAQANGATEDDTIVVPAGTYAVASPLTLTCNAPTRITIDGAGANTTIIRAFVDGGRVLVAGSNSQLEVRDVTLRDGNAGAQAVGGNVLADLGASLDAAARPADQRPRAARRRARGAGRGRRSTISQSLIDTNFAIGPR